jgi:hypothetical protein
LYLAVCLIAVKDWAKPPSDHVDPYQQISPQRSSKAIVRVWE